LPGFTPEVDAEAAFNLFSEHLAVIETFVFLEGSVLSTAFGWSD
jgi:hypothetical protein